MLSIGDLARHAGVSVRMLRHYDALGLVVPERVDAGTGYRWYAASQIGRVHSLIALKELGFTLEKCRAILDEQVSQVSAEALRDLLAQRRAALEQRIAADSERLAEVGRRLRSIERGLAMAEDTLRITRLPALRLAQVSGEVNDTTEIPALADLLARRLVADGPVVHTYCGRPDGTKIDVAVGLLLAPGDDPAPGLDLVELAAEDHAATVVHCGPAEAIGDAWEAQGAALARRGLEPYGVQREIHLDGGAVELHSPVREIHFTART